MNEMVERVSAAIISAARIPGSDMARMVIAAMREPTEAMVEVGEELEPCIGITDIYTAMIDEALK